MALRAEDSTHIHAFGKCPNCIGFCLCSLAQSTGAFLLAHKSCREPGPVALRPEGFHDLCAAPGQNTGTQDQVEQSELKAIEREKNVP
jgi:hypothetical protein